ncbi:MAG: hypothetical protein CMC68_04610 [Flavobacteriaceae bacterium]|nr:hypothetical protein [Flavobacteriaceae bacterium]|tara:strand:- start:717 stop:1316 length:600 start_codon:yes stop_codon:yes gene_type:complete
MKVNWKNDSILKNYNDETKPSDIFKEVCDLVGDYYSEMGWKYYGSRPKIKRESNDLIVEINFLSSRSNMSGSYIQLEILPYVSSKKLKKWIKENDIGRNSFIYAPKNYSFRNNNVYGITEDEFSSLLSEMDNFIENKLDIENNDKFIENILKNIDESIEDNFACYLAMKKDKRMFEVIEYDNGHKIDKLMIDKLKKYYS